MKYFILISFIFLIRCTNTSNHIKADELFSKGNYYYNKRMLDSALYFYSQAIDIDNSNCEAFKQRGLCYSDMEEYNMSSGDFSIAINLGCSDSDKIYNYIGYNYVKLEEFELAIIAYSRAIMINDSIDYYFSNRAECKLFLHPPDIEGACVDYNQCLSLNDTLKPVEKFIILCKAKSK